MIVALCACWPSALCCIKVDGDATKYTENKIMWTLGVSSGGLLLLMWICTGVRPVCCNRACCCGCTDDLN